jgi:hypothetical protein
VVVGRHEQQLVERGHVLEQPQRVQHRLDALVSQPLGSVHDRAGERSDPAPLAVLGNQVVGGCDTGVGLVVGERQHDPGQRDPVRDAVRHPRVDGGATAEAVDEERLPQRLGPVERHAHPVADEPLERRLVARRRQGDLPDVPVEGEVGVVGEGRVGQGPVMVDHLLVEPREPRHQPLLEQLPREFPVDRLVEPHHGVDDHEVGRPVHVQPGCVGRGHAMCRGHCALPVSHRRR